MKLSKSQITKVQRALTNHNKYQGCYFWKGISGASSRRRQEEQDTFEVAFKHEGKSYRYASSVTCSCKNTYYSGTFQVDGVTKNVRLFKKLIGE